MNDEFSTLIDGYLDDCLSPEESLRLNTLLQGNPEVARRFAREMLLHDRLHAELQAGALADRDYNALRPAIHASSSHRALPYKRWAMTATAAIAALLLVAVFLWHGGAETPASAAMVTLDRLIEVASQPMVRHYRIRVTDWGPGGVEPVVQSGGGGRKPGVDGAELYVRGPDQFVLIRHFGNGTTFVTGCDGVLGWAVAPKGAIHVSNDRRRFRRGVPGEHEEIPFLDLNAGFRELRRDYSLNIKSADRGNDEPNDWSRLDAVKRSPRRNAPEQVHVWFDTVVVARRIELVGMSEDHGGPRGVMLELIDQRDVGPEYFKHESHHDADRRVDWE